MAKNWGVIRLVTRVAPDSYEHYRQEFIEELQKDGVTRQFCYMSNSGAYVIFHRGHNYDENELEAAKIMADNGIIVHLTSEKDITEATATFINEDGNRIYKYSDGRLSMDLISYEQKTRTLPLNAADDAGAKWVKGALKHGQDKLSRISVIYDKGGVLHRNDIANGIKLYEDIPANAHRFDVILVISKNGIVYEWSHN